jgi:uncharacterized delta-60 repeat protein
MCVVHRSPVNRVRLHVESLEDRTLLSGGALDPTFGSGGIATFSSPVPVQLSGFSRIAVQEDGKIIVAQATNPMPYIPYYHIVVSRLNADGSLDISFGAGGNAVLHFPFAQQYPEPVPKAVAIQSDGKIVIAAEYGLGIDVARLKPDGSIDVSFGPGGNGQAVFSGNTDGYVYASGLALQPDGKIIVAGTLEARSGPATPTPEHFLALRFDENGNLDSTFGRSGVVVAGDGAPVAVALEPTGDIVLAGGVYDYYHNTSYVAVKRLHTDGTLDGDFVTDAGLFVGETGSVATGVAIQDDGKIVVTGQRSLPPKNELTGELAVARLLDDGSLDATFGDHGQAYFSFASLDPTSKILESENVQLRADGGIVFLSLVRLGSHFESAIGVIQLSNNGSLDPDFGIGGKVIVRAPQDDDVSFAPQSVLADQSVLQPDGKLLICGVTSDGEGGFFRLGHFLVVRLTGDVGPLQLVYEIPPPPVTHDPSPVTADPSGSTAETDQPPASPSTSTPDTAPPETPDPAQTPAGFTTANTTVGNQTAGLVLASTAAPRPVPNQASQPPSPAPVSSVANTGSTRPAASGAVLSYPAGGGTGSLSGDESTTNVPTSTLLSGSDLSVSLVAPIAPLRQASDPGWLDAFFSGEWVLPPALDASSASPAPVQSLAESGRVVGHTVTNDAAESSASSLAVALVLLGSTLTVETRTRTHRLVPATK